MARVAAWHSILGDVDLVVAMHRARRCARNGERLDLIEPGLFVIAQQEHDTRYAPPRQPPVEPDPPSQPYLDARAALFGDEDHEARVATRSIRCPYCGAAPGERCKVNATGKPLSHRFAHPSREEAAARIGGLAHPDVVG